MRSWSRRREQYRQRKLKRRQKRQGRRRQKSARPILGQPQPCAEQPFTEALHQFLTPQVWKQGHQAWQKPHYECRWCLKAIVWVMLLMTWGLGQSEAERFQTARAFYVSRRRGSKRPGETWEGFRKALARLPLRVWRALAGGVRQQLDADGLTDLRIGGYVPFGCDGSRLECPRSEELEVWLGQAGKEASAPTLYVSTLVLLPAGIPWAWQVGKGTASEHTQLTAMLPTLPERSLLVCDAGYVSYQLYQSILAAPAAFLVRMSSRAYLYTEKHLRLKRFREGPVVYWPGEAQRKGWPPIQARLVRVRGEKADVWLLTNLGRDILSARQVGQIYRWRWHNEGLFRTYKRTLAKVKLQHRTVRLVHREAEASLLAVQLLMAMTARAHDQSKVGAASPRRLLLKIRGEVQAGIADLGPVQRRRYIAALQEIHGETPHRTSPKTRRPWPRKKTHKPPGPPHLQRLTSLQKTLLRKILSAA